MHARFCLVSLLPVLMAVACSRTDEAANDATSGPDGKAQ
jgi:hypothetical protein